MAKRLEAPEEHDIEQAVVSAACLVRSPLSARPIAIAAGRLRGDGLHARRIGKSR
jgi:hypothetical protein